MTLKSVMTADARYLLGSKYTKNAFAAESRSQMHFWEGKGKGKAKERKLRGRENTLEIKFWLPSCVHTYTVHAQLLSTAACKTNDGKSRRQIIAIKHSEQPQLAHLQSVHNTVSPQKHSYAYTYTVWARKETRSSATAEIARICGQNAK